MVFVGFNRQYFRSDHYGEVWDFFGRLYAGQTLLSVESEFDLKFPNAT
jgi:hypothetical protein